MNGTFTAKPGSSMARVIASAESLGLEIELQTMELSTKTAEDAARACNCNVNQIVKSLIFECLDTNSLVLLLVSGAHNADLDHLSARYDLRLAQCDGRRVRDETGFAIGGVAPFGHLKPIDTFMDEDLLRYDIVWAAAGRPDTVFRMNPKVYAEAAKPRIISVSP